MEPKKEHFFVSSERYQFDFSHEIKRGWKQYDTSQDAWYYGVWYNPESMQTLNYCEGDIYLNTFYKWSQFKAELKGMDSFHGAQPAMAIAGDTIDMNLQIKNPVAIYDSDARWDYDAPEPEHREPTPSWQIQLIFEKAEVVNG
jgi:hypothetical protein